MDQDTLRWHKSKIISSHVTDGGLLFAIVTSDALNMNNTKRGFRYVIFDVFGTVLARTELVNAYGKSEQARKAMWNELNSINAVGATRSAIELAAKHFEEELARLACDVDTIESEGGKARP